MSLFGVYSLLLPPILKQNISKNKKNLINIQCGSTVAYNLWLFVCKHLRRMFDQEGNSINDSELATNYTLKKITNQQSCQLAN